MKIYKKIAIASLIGICLLANAQAKEAFIQTLPDGTKEIQGSDGSKIQIKPDGSKWVQRPDGTQVKIKPDGSKEIEKTDGSTIKVQKPVHEGIEALPEGMQTILNQPKYTHGLWGIYAKDLNTGKVLIDVNGNKMFSPASTSKLFSVAALLHAYGDDYRFKTPVLGSAPIVNGELKGNLILVAQGDMTFGGRQSDKDHIAFTKMDHINANDVPGTILTKEDPLFAIQDLARQLYQRGLRTLTGDIMIDDSLFTTTEKRQVVLSPILINENLIDLVVNPSQVGEKAEITWRPQVQGYGVQNEVKTVDKNGPLALEVSSDDSGAHVVIKGTIPLGEKDVVRTAPIKDPKAFARQAFIEALQNQGIVFNQSANTSVSGANASSSLEPLALWTSPPLSEYAKLILKVSHNTGANLIPLLLASQQKKKTYDEGMLLIGDFLIKKVGLARDSFVMADAAGGNENRFTPLGEVQLLEFIHKLPKEQFQAYLDALPVLGQDGSLADFAKNSPAAGKVKAKTGTGVGMNFATGELFLITQALSGYIEGKQGNLIGYMLVINNGKMPAIEDIFAIFEDEGQLSSLIYDKF